MTPQNARTSGKSETESSRQNSDRKFWQTALLLAASAAFGGLTVALWNRKTLADMRNRAPEQPPRAPGREDDIY
jgi:hypothetical protein